MAEDTDGILYLLNKFKGVSNGYLVDIGAHDGVVKGSMSRALVLDGWAGLMVEPLPKAYTLLQHAYAYHPKVHTIQAVCSDAEGTAQLLPCLGVSTLDPKWAKACSDWWPHVKYGEPITVVKRKLSALLKQVNAPQHINLLQIDTEGHDFSVLRGMDWKRTVDVICVETLDMVHPERKERGIWRPDPMMNDYLGSLGFKLSLLTKGGNGFYVRGDAS